MVAFQVLELGCVLSQLYENFFWFSVDLHLKYLCGIQHLHVRKQKENQTKISRIPA